MLIFDCDGVLVDSEPIANRVLAEHFTAHGYPITTEESIDRFVGGSIPLIVQGVRDEGVNIPDDFTTTLRIKERAAFDHDLQVIPGIAQALKMLDGQQKCVASSGPMPKIEGNLRLTGLFDLFVPNIFSATMVDHPKPAPDLFLFAAQSMHAHPNECTVIEDSPKGVEAALRAGMRVLAFTGGGHVTSPHIEKLSAAGATTFFDDMRQLPVLLTNFAN